MLDTSPTPATADTETLKHRARLGVVMLVARGTTIQLAHLGGTVILARLLRPEDFGIFAIVQFVISFFAFFGEAGLGAALIQQPTVPSHRQLSTVFNLQVLLSLAVIAIVGVSADSLRLVWHDMPVAAAWLVRAVSVSLLFLSMRVVPSILMERELHFGRLSVIEVIQTLSYYAVGISMAYAGMRVWSLAAAVLAHATTGVVGCFIARPWRPQMVLDLAEIKPVVRFGIAYQVKNLAGLVNAAVVPAYAGAALGTRALGFLEWAQSTAFFPLKLVEVMSRVTFPLFSRIHDDRDLFAGTLERAVLLCAMGTFLMCGLFFGIGPSIVHVIFSDQWLPALPLLYIYAAAISIGFLSPLIASTLDAMGRPKLFAYIAIGWTILNWVAAPIGAHWGARGFAFGYSVHILVGNLVIVFVLRRLIPGARLWSRLWAVAVAAAAIIVVGRFYLTAATGLGLTAAVVAAIALFAAVLTLLDRTALKDALAIVR
jgi:PST family polysaccharide transporter